MPALLQQLYSQTDVAKAPFFCGLERIDFFSNLLSRTTNAADQIEPQSALAQEFLFSGQPGRALEQFGSVEQLFKRSPALATTRNVVLLRHYRALCYLWQGEYDNCLSKHEPDACLFTPEKMSPHKNTTATVEAIKILTYQLMRNPKDRRALWLLNISYMRTGEYPNQVPPEWRIPPPCFASEYDIKRFPDIAPALNLDLKQLAGSCISEDFDGDGYLDLMVSAWDFKGFLRFFRNQGDGTFAERSREAGVLGETGVLNMLQTDYNNDGLPDVFLLRGGWLLESGRLPNSLLRNNGDGTFSNVTEAAGLLSFHPTQTAVWSDFNNDGWLDLFVGNESAGQSLHPCEFFRNNRNGTFTECAQQAGVATIGYVKGVAAGDYNHDGWPDLYLSILASPNMLLRNDGPRGTHSATNGSATVDCQFTDVALPAGVTEPRYSFPTWFWDYDNDGWLDLFVAGYRTQNVGDIAADYMGLPHSAERSRLFRNNHDGTFSNVSQAMGLYKVILAMGANTAISTMMAGWMPISRLVTPILPPLFPTACSVMPPLGSSKK